jgi:DNA-binding MarR family transcriptional regulator
MYLSPPYAPTSTEEAVLITLMQLGRRMRQRHQLDSVDPAAMPVLHMLRCCGRIRVTDLAGRLHLDASTVSRHVRQLEERGLIERTSDPADGRASQVALLPQGEKSLDAAMERRRADIAQVLAGWPASDRARLGELMSRFADDLARATDQDQRLVSDSENR